MNSECRIWHPNVQVIGSHLPKPGSINSKCDESYTKTSLEMDDEKALKLRALNREILARASSHNSTPRPYSGLQSQSSLPNRHSDNSASNGQQFCYRDRPQTERKMEERAQLQRSSSQPYGSTPQASQAANSSNQKLCHNQYNSPMNLYSMENIRKTIEAQTEMIAPGLKGINFMKQATPVNKQSEVYKLIKEEEEQNQHQRNTLRSDENPTHRSTLERFHSPSLAGSSKSFDSAPRVNLGATRGQSDQQSARAMQGVRSNVPTCSECGLTIVGPFSKVMDRSIHPACFCCTTCGSSLKNVGFFTVNEKLYCDLHAKQAAKLLHQDYNYRDASMPNQQVNSGPSDRLYVRPLEHEQR